MMSFAAHSPSAAVTGSGLALALLLASASAGDAQRVYPPGDVNRGASVHLVPRAGAYLTVDGLTDLPDGAARAIRGDSARAAVGASVAFGSAAAPWSLRVTGLTSTGSLISAREISSPSEPVRDRVSMLSAELVYRPVGRVFGLRPYLIGGIGARAAALGTGPGGSGGGSASGGGGPEGERKTEWDRTRLLGAGVDVKLGTRGATLSAELFDYSTDPGEDDDRQHDGFLTLGIGVPIF